jgi:hypothetical protein
MGAELSLLSVCNRLLVGYRHRSGDQPCLCLWRAFSQITRTTPRRRMILHFSQTFFTDALTFMV